MKNSEKIAGLAARISRLELGADVAAELVDKRLGLIEGAKLEMIGSTDHAHGRINQVEASHVGFVRRLGALERHSHEPQEIEPRVIRALLKLGMIVKSGDGLAWLIAHARPIDRGAWAVLDAQGDACRELFDVTPAPCLALDRQESLVESLDDYSAELPRPPDSNVRDLTREELADAVELVEAAAPADWLEPAKVHADRVQLGETVTFHRPSRLCITFPDGTVVLESAAQLREIIRWWCDYHPPALVPHETAQVDAALHGGLGHDGNDT